MSTKEPTMSSKGSSVVGIVVAALILGSIASIGYYQVEVAPKLVVTTTSAPAVTCPSSACVNVTIPNSASTQPQGYTPGSKTQYGFSPDAITVIIGKNNTVFWTNDDVSIHTATSDTANVFDTGNILAGNSQQFTFTTPGTFTYHCSYHAWMQGTIIVKSS
ncbi:MAG TPA: cupredoxin domain-containing protein [Nitrososphaerales archaeon]|nr:cupredoxin domain-containing protein [Nitrososphaerales archaeon]